MTVQDTSLIAFEKLREQLEPDEQAVFEILLELGPTHDRRILEALNQKEQATLKPRCQKRIWEINSVTGRRNALVGEYNIVRDLGPHRGTWRGQKKNYHIWAVAGDERGAPPGWEPVQIKEHKTVNTKLQKEHLQEIRQKAEEPVLRRLTASAGEQFVLFA